MKSTAEELMQNSHRLCQRSEKRANVTNILNKMVKKSARKLVGKKIFKEFSCGTAQVKEDYERQKAEKIRQIWFTNQYVDAFL